jgi:hypothetical protein
LFVSSLGHSGSTLLDLLLGADTRFVGVGEAARYLVRLPDEDDPDPEYDCGCGEHHASCPLWGPVRSEIIDRRVTSLADRYGVLMRHVADLDPGATVVDSSKTVEALEALATTGVALWVVSLTRDVRSWSTSVRFRDAARGDLALRDLLGRVGVARAVRQHLARRPTARFLHWYRENRRRVAAIERLGLPCFELTYERLARSPDSCVAELVTWLAMPERSDRPRSHQICGNQMRHGVGAAVVRYDTRWLDSDSWLAPSFTLRPVMRYNRSTQLRFGPRPRP